MAMTYQQAQAVLARRDYEREERRRATWRRFGRRVRALVVTAAVIAGAAGGLQAYLPYGHAMSDRIDAIAAGTWDRVLESTGATGVDAQVAGHTARLSDAIFVSTGDAELAEIELDRP